MRWSPLLVALALLLALAPAATQAAPGNGAASEWSVAVVLDNAKLRPAKAFEAFDTASLNLYDFNGDGKLEIIANNDNNRAYVIDPDPVAPRILAEIATKQVSDEGWEIRELNPISVGDLYGDDVPCLVIPNSASWMSAWCYNAANSTAERFHFDKKWEVRVDAAKYEPDFDEQHPWIQDGTYPGLDGHAYLADVDKDGTLEIFVETDGYPGQFAFNHDGTYRWSRSFADGNAGARVADIDKDGRLDAVFVSDAGLITAYDASTGAVKWVFDARKHGSNPGSIPVFPLLADLHGDGKMEIVFGTRNVHPNLTDPDWIEKSHAMYFAINHKGQVLWNRTFDWGNPLQYNHPAASDVNGDGVLDVVFLDWNTIGHNPGDWNTTGRQSNLFVLDGTDGDAIWHRGITVYWSNKDFVIADLGGGDSIIAPTAKGGSDGLGIYDLKTGEPEGWFPLEWQQSRGPVAGNVYGDGKLTLVVPISKKQDRPNYRDLDVGLREGKLVVIRTGADYDVLFSANFLNSAEQKEKQVQGSTGVAPTPIATTTPPTVAPTPDANLTSPENDTVPPPPTNVTTTTPPPTNGTPPTDFVGEPPPTEAIEDRGIPGPGVALLAAGAAAALVLARRRR